VASAYETLGVARDADAETIDETYREAVIANHPDQGGDAATLAEIRGAYERIKLLRESDDAPSTSAADSQAAAPSHTDPAAAESNDPESSAGEQAAAPSSGGEADEPPDAAAEPNESATTTERDTQQTETCSDCGKTGRITAEAFRSDNGTVYCSSCYEQTVCNRCGTSIPTTLEGHRESGGPTYCAYCAVDTHCSGCGTSLTVVVDDYDPSDPEQYCEDCRVQTVCTHCGQTIHVSYGDYDPNQSEYYCSDCSVDTYCSRCGSEFTVSFGDYDPQKSEHFCASCSVEMDCTVCEQSISIGKPHVEDGTNEVCPACDLSELEGGDSQFATRRKVLSGAGLLTLGGVGGQAYRAGYLTGTLGQPEPTTEKTIELDLSSKPYRAVEFSGVAGGSLEYALEGVKSGMESRLFRAAEFERFERGVETAGRTDQGEPIAAGSSSALANETTYEAELPADDDYALVFLPSDHEDKRSRLSLQVFPPRSLFGVEF